MPAISALALDVVAKVLRLTLPYPLAVRSRGATAAERAANREWAVDELHDADLLDHTGAPGPHRRRPPARTRCRAVRAVAALSGRSAVLAVQRDTDTVRLRSVSKDQLVAVIVQLLPEHRRARRTARRSRG